MDLIKLAQTQMVNRKIRVKSLSIYLLRKFPFINALYEKNAGYIAMELVKTLLRLWNAMIVKLKERALP